MMVMQASDVDHWSQWRVRRDARTFGSVVADHVTYAYDFARRVTGHDADAEDVAQQALLELTEASPELIERVGIRAFLGRRIVLNARTLRRSALTRQRHESRAAPGAPADPFAARDAREQVDNALRLLDEPERRAVVLRYLHGLSHDEIAHVFGIREEAVRMRVHRAMRRLRRRLGPRPEAALGGMALFLAPKALARSTVKVASLTGGVVAVGVASRFAVCLTLIVAVCGGGYLLHVARDARESKGVPRAGRSPSRGLPDGDDVAEKQQPEPSNTGGGQGAEPTATEGETVLRGELRTTDGMPASGVGLQLDGAFFDDGVVTTDKAGRFRIEDAEAGDRTLYIKSGTGHLLLRTVAVRPHEASEVSIVLHPGTTLKGAVTADERPLEGALVLVTRTGGLTELEQGRNGHAMTRADGLFRIDRLPAGTYEVKIHRVGYAPTIRRVVLPRDGEPLAVALEKSQPTAVRLLDVPPALAGMDVQLTIRPRAPGMPTRAVPARLQEGRLVPFDRPASGSYELAILLPYALGAPIASREVDGGPDAGPEIEMRVPAGGRLQGTVVGKGRRTVVLEPGLYTAEADPAGAFALDYVKPGAYAVFVKSGTGRVVAGSVEVSANTTSEHVVRLAGNASVRGGLRPVPARGSGRVELSRAGQPVGDATIDFRGEFRLGFLEPGEYELVVSVGETQVERSFVSVGAGGEHDVGVVDASSLSSVPVAVTVPAGSRMPRAIAISITRGGRVVQQIVHLDADGRGLLKRMPPGRALLRFVADGFGEGEVECHAPSRTPLDVQVERG
ncbi:MAG: sigma-70 family RNA polymerase sigma factor [Planctomycetota bacterium]|jgi:RNA polymerase sigma-70 factor (ECF subfamily)